MDEIDPNIENEIKKIIIYQMVITGAFIISLVALAYYFIRHV